MINKVGYHGPFCCLQLLAASDKMIAGKVHKENGRRAKMSWR